MPGWIVYNKGNRMETSSAPIISIRHLSAGYEDETILQDVNLDVYPGDFIGLIGPNGGGKSTLLKVILGLLTPRHGEVRVMGMDARRGRKFAGYVPQFFEPDRDFPVSVRDTVRMGLLDGWRLFERLSAPETARIEAALAQAEILNLSREPMGELSGGQRQRVLIARALVSDPKILLLDEPTASVDPNVTRDIYELFSQLNRRMAILMVSHDMMAVSSFTKTIACLNRRLVYHNSKELTPEVLEGVYGCPVDLIAHGVPHRVLPAHLENKDG